jgi:hypothetical protein
MNEPNARADCGKTPCCHACMAGRKPTSGGVGRWDGVFDVEPEQDVVLPVLGVEDEPS